MRISMRSSMRSNVVSTGLVMVMTLFVVACGSTPKPEAELALSNAAVLSAEQAGAREFAPVELRQAREKNDAAKLAYAGKNMASAKQLAERALADAQLAHAKADAEKSRVALKELREGIDVMRSEITRVRDN